MLKKNTTLKHIGMIILFSFYYGNLDLRWNNIREAGEQIADAVAQNTNVTELFASGNAIPIDVISKIGIIKNHLLIFNLEQSCANNQNGQLHMADVPVTTYHNSHIEKQAEKRLLSAHAEKASLASQLEDVTEKHLTLAERLQNLQIAYETLNENYEKSLLENSNLKKVVEASDLRVKDLNDLLEGATEVFVILNIPY